MAPKQIIEDPSKKAHEAVREGCNRRQTWDDFRSAGMLWLVNRSLHMFGWAIVVATNEDDTETLEVYPVRTGWRGFSPESEARGYGRVAQWMRDASDAIRSEADR